MSKLIKAFLFESHVLQNHGLTFRKPLLSSMPSSAEFSHHRAFSSTPNPNPKNTVLVDYLINSLKFSKDEALSVSSSYARTKSLENPQEVVRFFKGLGFSDAHIHSIARAVPCVLFTDIGKILKPKVTFLQELGLRDLIFRNPCVLRASQKRTLRPSIHLIKKVFESDGRCKSEKRVSEDLLRVLTRCSKICYLTSRVEANILYLESRGIVGSQLSTLLLNRSRLFALPKEKVEELVSRAADMNFHMGSRMLVHAITVLSCASLKTLDGRFEIFRKFGFSKGELASMFRKSPHTFALSEAHLGRKLEFFLNEMKIDRLVIVGFPRLLCSSLEKRIIPRCNVLLVLKSRGLLRRDLGLHTAMCISDKRFSEKYILPFRDEVKALLLAEKGK